MGGSGDRGDMEEGRGDGWNRDIHEVDGFLKKNINHSSSSIVFNLIFSLFSSFKLIFRLLKRLPTNHFFVF